MAFIHSLKTENFKSFDLFYEVRRNLLIFFTFEKLEKKKYPRLPVRVVWVVISDWYKSADRYSFDI